MKKDPKKFAAAHAWEEESAAAQSLEALWEEGCFDLWQIAILAIRWFGPMVWADGLGRWLAPMARKEKCGDLREERPPL
ncbi:MAG: hypothetical protein ACRBBK_03295 [Paracoccaceae bacterium]